MPTSHKKIHFKDNRRLHAWMVGTVMFIFGTISFIARMKGYPPVLRPFFGSVPADKVEIMAHGAGQGVAPTNTLTALKIAQAQGADVLEIDVQLTKDNVLVLQHDDTFDRTTGMTGPVASKTWADIVAQDKGRETVVNGTKFVAADSKVSRLDDVLAALPNVRWNIEIKNDGAMAAKQLCQSIQRADIERETLVASFHDAAINSFRQECHYVGTSMSPAEIRSFVIAAHLGVSRFIKTPAIAVQVPVEASGFDLTSPRFIAALKARNIALHYWTINDPAQMDTLIKAGADGLLTDFVVRGQEAVARTR